MLKYTRTAYAEVSLRETLRELVNDAGLTDLPTMNSSLRPRPGSDREHVRITITIEKVKQKPQQMKREPYNGPWPNFAGINQSAKTGELS